MNFQEVIKQYLDDRAAQDEQFAVTYAKENKSIEECCKYILGEARKLGNEVCMSDEEVYGLAVHYYDEDDIKIEAVPASFVSTPKVDLTEDDKERAKKAAIAQYQAEVLASMKKKPKKAEPVEQMRLF